MGSGVKCGRTARGAAHWDEAASSADLGRPTALRAAGWVAGQAEHCMCRANSRSMHARPNQVNVSVGDTIQSSGKKAAQNQELVTHHSAHVLVNTHSHWWGAKFSLGDSHLPSRLPVHRFEVGWGMRRKVATKTAL